MSKIISDNGFTFAKKRLVVSVVAIALALKSKPLDPD
jgi:hypothetical protein